MMKILFVGHHMPHYLHTNVYREKAIRELGHELIFFDDRKFILPGRIRDRVVILQKWDFNRLNYKLIETAKDTQPDLIIVMGTRLPLPTSDTLRKLRKSCSRIVLWVTDAPRHQGFSLIEKTAPLYDHVFCAGTEHMEIFEMLGVHRMSWLSFACDPDYHKPQKLSDAEKRKLGHDIVFVGAYYPNRWKIIDTLESFDVGVWGPYWKQDVGNVSHSAHIYNQKVDVTEWTKIYSAAKIVLVIHYQDGATICHQASPKVYEALACGCFVLVDRQKDVFRVFKDGNHLVGFDSARDLREKVSWYLDHPEDRKRISESGLHEVLRNHTYRHRIQMIMDTVFS